MQLSLVYLVDWISIHGAYVLFVFLALGIIGLPIPDETLLIIAGTLINQQVLSLPITILCVLLGTMTGITISFYIGKLINISVLHMLMRKFNLNTKYWEHMIAWYQKFGKWSLTFGYFIPGVRHFSGIFSGLMALSYLQFAIFAYFGALLWSSVFLSLGYFVGNKALVFIHLLFDKYGYGIIIVTTLILLVIGIYSYKVLKKN
ncbi:MAG: alkaline phosphatase [Legionellales bacterium]|nr:alkaline phosphatase [Legionellales bacterium]|tara:strand:- start:206 stop:814 length:609 start_codon:yes stop_codon:yes gene_type:complete